MKKILVFCLLSGLVVACSKDKFQTTPQIKINSISSNIIPVNGSLRVLLEFTDKEGDVSDTVILNKVRLNQRAVTTLRDSIKFKVPDFPKNNQGEIELDLDYQTHLISAISPPFIPNSNPKQKEPDTLALKFVLQDKAGHRSDAATTNVIVIR